MFVVRIPIVLHLAVALVALPVTIAPATADSLRTVITKTLQTNPAVREAEANRRATEYELLQSQGRLLPELDVTASIGPEYIEQPGDDAQWLGGRQIGFSLRQFLFDGWERENDIYRNAARVDAAALRVLSRSEALALQAIEAYIDVARQSEVLAVAQRNVARHRAILRQVRIRKEGGKAGVGEVNQVDERIAAAEAAVVQVRQSLDLASARYERVVGAKPGALVSPSLPTGLPSTVEMAVQYGRANNPSVQAAEADIDVAMRAADQSEAAFLPTLGVELNSLHGYDIGGSQGGTEEYLGKVTLSWKIFDGAQRQHRRLELRERAAQADAARDVRAREVAERIEAAFASFRSGGERSRVLRRQVDAATRVVATYEDEYKLSKRSLLDLLDAENTKFNVRISVISANSVEVFSAYRLLAETGRLLEWLDVPVSPAAVANQRDTIETQGLFSVSLSPLSLD